MYQRLLTQKLLEAAQRYPAITVTGPRQSGKTTLVKAIFSEHIYVSLEAPDVRSFALEDPRGFLNQFDEKCVIFDEVQRVPELFSYLQGIIDAQDTPGRFILTGSQNFLLLKSISQTLAGRTAIFHLLPFSLEELEQRPGISLEALSSLSSKREVASSGRNLYQTIWEGFYPRVHDKKIPAQDWLSNYYQTYLERDVRDLLQVGDLASFSRFVRLCAGRAGQLLNMSAIAVEAGITHSTARRWLSVLEISFVVFLLTPHYQNFNKRLTKSPKLYFWDTGLLCYLLSITDPKQLPMHASRGALFENFIIQELLKKAIHNGQAPKLAFWRDSSGHEIDGVLEHDSQLIPIEIKSSETFHKEYLQGIDYWNKLASKSKGQGILFYGGRDSFEFQGKQVYSWNVL